MFFWKFVLSVFCFFFFKFQAKYYVYVYNCLSYKFLNVESVPNIKNVYTIDWVFEYWNKYFAGNNFQIFYYFNNKYKKPIDFQQIVKNSKLFLKKFEINIIQFI